MSAIQLSHVIAVQALYLNFIFHSSGDFSLKQFLDCVLFFPVKSLYLWHKLNFLINCKQKIHGRISLFASSKMNFTVESNIYFRLSL